MTSYWSSSRFAESAEWRQQTYKLLRQLEELHSPLDDAQRGERGYLLTGDEAYLKPFNEARQQVSRALEEARDLTREIDTQHRRMATPGDLPQEELDDPEGNIG